MLMHSSRVLTKIIVSLTSLIVKDNFFRDVNDVGFVFIFSHYFFPRNQRSASPRNARDKGFILWSRAVLINRPREGSVSGCFT